jgi:hypothetical protein
MALNNGLKAACAAAISLLVLFLVVVPAQADTPRWVRGDGPACASSTGLGDGARLSVREARFLCFTGVGPSVSRIEFRIDGRTAATERYAPYSLRGQEGWPATPGRHVLQAKVVQRNGSVRSFRLIVTVLPTPARGASPTSAPLPTTVVPTTTPPTTTVTPTTTRTPTATSTTSSTTTSTTTRPIPGSWPGPGNTGVPAGITLTRYTGPCDIRTANTVIDSKTIDCDGMLVYASGVVIRNSRVLGSVRTNSPTASLRIEDSEVDGGSDQSEAVGLDNVTVLRSNIYGNQHTVHCNDNCHVEDSWLHDQFDGAARGWHQNGFLSNGGSNITLRHNTIHCRGGCTADIALIPDGDISDVLIESNLLVASPDSAYCLYAGGHSGNKPGWASNIVIRDNVVQRGPNNRCATYGPVTYFRAGSGNQWLNNRWDDGTVLPPAN